MTALGRHLAWPVGVAIIAAAVVPLWVSGPSLDETAIALALVGPACGTAIAAAAGRPLLAAAALAGVGGYVSAVVSRHGAGVPLAVLCGCAAGMVAGTLMATLGARLGSTAFLAMSALVVLLLGDGLQAVPRTTGGQNGLEVRGLSFSVGGRRTLALTPQGDFHLLLLVATIVTITATLLIRWGPGPAWRAIGSDRRRASMTGVRCLAGELSALGTAGAMSGLCGALAAHVNRIASPDEFGLYLGALPLLATFAAGNDPVAAAFVVVATGVGGDVVLPWAGWVGPPSGETLALAALAAGTLIVRVPATDRDAERPTVVISPDDPWPLEGMGLRGATLEVPPIVCRSPAGAVLVDAPGIRLLAGRVHAVVGPNGSGKSTLLTEIHRRASQGRLEGIRVGGRAPLLLLPQEGGGFADCTVAETLVIAARPGRTRRDAGRLAAAWLDRLGLGGLAGRRCRELSAGQRRLLDLARLLLRSPGVLLCDEPLAGLDDDYRAAALACLDSAARAGLTIVISEHDRHAVALLADTVTELARDPERDLGAGVVP